MLDGSWYLSSMIVRERMHSLLLERGPMRSREIADALGVSQQAVSNAGRDLIDAGRATRSSHGAPFEAIAPTPEEATRRAAWSEVAAASVPAPERGPSHAPDDDRPDLARIAVEASRMAAGPFGYLLWVDARCIDHLMPALSPWWRYSIGEFYASGKRWGVYDVGRGGGKSSSLERFAATECFFAPRVVFPGQAWVWPFISVGVPDATRRLRGISAVYRAMRLPFAGEYAGGEKVKEGIRLSLASPAHMDLVDARGNEIQLLSIAGTVGNVSGPSTIGGTIDEAAKLLDKATNANPLTEIYTSITSTFRARHGIRAILSSSPKERAGMHFQLVEQGDTEITYVARIGDPFIDLALRGFEQVAAWEQHVKGDARAAAHIRTHAASLRATSPLVPTWVANPTLGNPEAGQPWEWAALASRRELEGIPEGSDQLEGLPRWALWLRECGAVPMDRAGGFDARQQFDGLAEANARLARTVHGAAPPSLGPQSHPLAPPGDPRYAGPSRGAGWQGGALGKVRLF